jgi:hypothetical protein
MYALLCTFFLLPLDRPPSLTEPTILCRVDLVVADFEHTMHIATYSKAFPSALCVGPDGVGEKIKEVKFAGEYQMNGEAGPGEQFGFEDEIITVRLPSLPLLPVRRLGSPLLIACADRLC